MRNVINIINKLSLNRKLNYRELIQKVSGDLVILGMKNTGKTTLLMNLARELRCSPNNHIIVFETFPKWVFEFDTIPYYFVTNNDIAKIKGTKDYTVKNKEEICNILKTNKDIIFSIECLDMEKISTFMSYVIYVIYRKQYLRAKNKQLENMGENYWFLTEEAHNLLDSSVLQKKVFNKLRKMQNEFRNLRMHLICVTLRLQDLNPKIRAKMDMLLGRISFDDYQLKLRAMLRDSKYKNEVLHLPTGMFIYPETNLVLLTEPFKQNGRPYEL